MIGSIRLGHWNRSVPSADVDVWFRPTADLDAAAIAAAAAMLSPDEVERYRRFHFAPDARDYAAAHALLRTTLSRHAHRAPADWRFEKTAAGKPVLIDTEGFPGSFSLSHSNGMVACAVTNAAAVGVDVECVDRDVDTDRLAGRFFSPEETAHLARLDAMPRRDRFFDLWTLKEALVKALGAGLAVPLASLAFAVDAGGTIRLDGPAEIGAQAWQFGLFAPGPSHRLAVAVRRSGGLPVQLVLREAAFS